MGDKKNIDRLFQEKFKDFEAFPERDLWSGLEAKLDVASAPAGILEKRKKAIPPLWWRLGGIAAALALLLSVGLSLVLTDPESPVIDPVEKVVKENTTAKDTEADEETTRSMDNNKSYGRGTQQDSNTITDNNQVAQQDNKDNTTNVKSHGRETQQDDNTITDNNQIAQQDNKDNIINVKSHGRGTQQDGNTITDNNQIAQRDNKDNTTNVKSHGRGAQQDNKDNTINVKPHGRVAQQDGKTITDNNQVAQQDNGEEENKKSLLEAIAEMENDTENEKQMALKEKENKKWSINPNVAPVYYNSLSSGSPIDPEFKDNSKSGKVNLSYGVNVAYQVNDRLSLRSGINKVNYGYNTNDISFAPDFEARSLSNINYTRQSEKASGLYVANSPVEGPPLAARDEVTASFTPQPGLMQQEFGYIEVPMELKYRVLNERFGLNLIGGVSSLFLTDNSVLLKSDALATELGEANNINNMNFSTNVGLGVDYLLSDKLQLQVEPMFKYQWNTFSNDNGGFRPYSFGVYTGFSFRF
ncbi:hypothetical protein [Sinomicrobium sp. M5D2P9]